MSLFKFKSLGRVGPRANSSGRYLKRTIEWRGDRFVYHANDKHVDDIIELMGVASSKGQATPGSKATGAAITDPEAITGDEAHMMARTIGCILYLALDRPELQYAAKVVASDISKPTELTRHRVKRVAKFLVDHPRLEWHFPVQDADMLGVLSGYSDSDWAADVVTRRSTTGFVIMHGHHTIDTGSASQLTIALSSAEAEFYASGRSSASLLMLCGVLAEMSLKRRIPVNYMDRDADRALATRIGVGRMRHIQVRWLWLQERIRDGDIAAKRVGGAKNVADLGTKHLEAGRRDELLDLMGLRLTRRRLTSSTRTAFVAAALQVQAADAATSTLETVVDVISVWVWILNDVMRPMAILLVLTIVAYRLWTWGPTPPARVQRPVMRSIASQTAVPPQTPPPAAADAAATTVVDGFSLDWLSMEQLKVLSRRHGLPTAGLKVDLCARLQIANRWALSETTL